MKKIVVSRGGHVTQCPIAGDVMHELKVRHIAHSEED